MLTLTEATELILRGARPLPVETVPLGAGLGRVLARPIVAARPLPPFDHSAMDGYALAYDSLADAASPVLPLVAESRTGHEGPGRVPPGHACRIFTGAPVPAGTDTVVMQEHTRRVAGGVEIIGQPRPGDHVRRAGEDLAAGEEALAAGCPLSAGHLALAGALDQARLEVFRAPRVAVLTTGDELRDAGDPAPPGTIVDTNGPLIAALVADAGGVVVLRRRVPDDLAATTAALAEAIELADLVLTVGGVSVGDHDHVRAAAERSGIELGLWKVAIKPGKPVLFGTRGAARLLGLPGNPLSAAVTFTLLARPLLRVLRGMDPPPAPSLARLLAAVQHKGGRLELVPCIWGLDASGRAEVRPLGRRASGSIPAVASCTGFFDFDSETSELPAGALVAYRPLYCHEG